jgi:flagellar biosynthesis/type III secretory pathway M-ring protein FliF/YscJ
MDSFSTLSTADWAVLALLASVVVLMVLGILSVRHEIRVAARMEARRRSLKTTEAQRRKWRQTTQARDLIDLLDDIDTLLKLDSEDAAARQAHKEAARLSWMSRHIPTGTLVVGGLLLIAVLSATLAVIAQGPHNPIP